MIKKLKQRLSNLKQSLEVTMAMIDDLYDIAKRKEDINERLDLYMEISVLASNVKDLANEVKEIEDLISTIGN